MQNSYINIYQKPIIIDLEILMSWTFNELKCELEIKVAKKKKLQKIGYKKV